MYLHRADFESVESEVQVEIDSRVSVEDTESDTFLIGSNHGDCIDVRWLKLGLLDPDGESWADTVQSVDACLVIVDLLSIWTTWEAE
jgi:hypothetical protein